jgi:hypothetical protein
MQPNPLSPSFQTSTPPRRSGPHRGLIISLIAGVLVLVLIGLVAFRYTGPTRTVQNYVNDLMVNFNAGAAYQQLCSDVQPKISIAQLQSFINASRKLDTSYDATGVTYTLVDENFFGDAHVRVGGTISVTADGHKQSYPMSGIGPLLILHSAGIGWCIGGAAIPDGDPISWSGGTGRLRLVGFKCYWAEIAEARMPTLTVVKDLNVRKDRAACLKVCLKVPFIQAFYFETCPETLHERIVIAVAGAAHTEIMPCPRKRA